MPTERGSDAPWFQGSLAAGYLQDSSDFAFPAEKVALTLQDGRFLFLLDAADAGKIDSLRLLTFADTGEHLLLLGNAPIFQQDAQGNFIAAEGRIPGCASTASPSAATAIPGHTMPTISWCPASVGRRR